MVKEMHYAGSFYPLGNLEEMLESFFSNLDLTEEKDLRGLIIPHASYLYSGITAAKAYSLLLGLEKFPKNIFILAPSHNYSIKKPCVGDFKSYETPFGFLNSNLNIVSDLVKKGLCEYNNEAIRIEHSLEVHLPFLAYIYFRRFNLDVNIIPIVLNAPSYELAEELKRYVNDNSLFIISSDLSHHLSQEDASKVDNSTINTILKRDAKKIDTIDACGSAGIATFNKIAKDMNLNPKLLQYTTSADVYKDYEQVVGYASIAYLDR
jgi:MEMO1 family protein